MNYKFIIATPLTKVEFQEKAAIAITLDKLGCDYDVVYENQEGLPKVYNRFISEENKDKKLIFVHDDVIVEDLFIFDKLNLAFEKFDIVGLAGATKCDLNAQAMAWHLMAPRESYVGEVAHSKSGINWTTVFGQTPARALVIDGLFIAVDVAKLLETGTRFDEDFSFHHYDISFCLQANKNKLKLGVYPIRVVHFGLGDSMNTPEWSASAKTFKDKYTKILLN
jgi:Glycosyltransferase like family